LPTLGESLAALNQLGNAGDFRLVFSLRVEGDGDYAFRLFDQLDHLGEGNDSELSIDFSGLFNAIDGDGDAIGLPGGTFTVTVEDSSPAAFTPGSVSVDEGALNGGNGD